MKILSIIVPKVYHVIFDRIKYTSFFNYIFEA